MFKLIAIEVLKPLSEEMVESRRYKSIHKILSFTKENLHTEVTSKIYYFHKGYVCENGRTGISNPDQVTDNTFYTGNGIRISFSAVVGENGMGKSSLLELFFRLINNTAYACKSGIEKGVSYNLLFVPDVYATAYFEDSNGQYFSITQFDNKLDCRFQDSPDDNWEYEWTSNQNSDNYVKKDDAIKRLDSLFYTVVVNYASYAYNTTDYMHEWDTNMFDKEIRNEEERCWLSALFHKNDSYQTPIVLNPFRESGNVNYNNERNLTQERLFQLVLNDRSPLKRVLRKKDAKALIFDLNTEYIPKRRRGNFYDSERVLWEMRQLRLLTTNKAYSCTVVSEISQCILNAWSRIMGFNLYARRNPAFWDFAANKDGIAAVNYIVYKTLKIINTYPSYSNYKFEITSSGYQDKHKVQVILRDAVKKMYEDTSHITLKLRRCLAFLLFGHYTSKQILCADGVIRGKRIEIDELKNRIDYCLMHTSEFTAKAKAEFGAVHVIKYAKEKPIKWDLNTLMPASFMHTDLSLQNIEGKEVNFNSLSSGEKQMIHAMSAILYQIGNIESAWGNKTKQAHYSKVCLVFDEIELYFHPKYQTMLVAFLIETLQGLRLQNVKDIQVVLSTHSPFILSDIPSSDVIMLKDGTQDQNNKKQVFGATVYDILNQNFFMEQFIGDFAVSKIMNIVAKTERAREYNDEEIKQLRDEIELIGDNLIRNTLLVKLEHNDKDRVQ